MNVTQVLLGVCLFTFACGSVDNFNRRVPQFCFGVASGAVDLWSGGTDDTGIFSGVAATVTEFGTDVSGADNCEYKLNLKLDYGAEITIGVHYEDSLQNATLPDYSGLTTGDELNVQFERYIWSDDELRLADASGVRYQFDAHGFGEDDRVELEPVAGMVLQQGDRISKGQSDCGMKTVYNLNVVTSSKTYEIAPMENAIVEIDKQRYEVTNLSTGYLRKSIFGTCTDTRYGDWIDYQIVRVE